MARLLIENVEGINSNEWEYFQRVFDEDCHAVLEYEVYGHKRYHVIELDVESERGGGGWCVYVRWDGSEEAFMTVEEAVEWLASEEGTDARVWAQEHFVSAPDRE